jgi:hypothetical protein
MHRPSRRLSKGPDHRGLGKETIMAEQTPQPDRVTGGASAIARLNDCFATTSTHLAATGW